MVIKKRSAIFAVSLSDRLLINPFLEECIKTSQFSFLQSYSSQDRMNSEAISDEFTIDRTIKKTFFFPEIPLFLNKTLRLKDKNSLWPFVKF